MMNTEFCVKLFGLVARHKNPTLVMLQLESLSELALVVDMSCVTPLSIATNNIPLLSVSHHVNKSPIKSETHAVACALYFWCQYLPKKITGIYRQGAAWVW